MYTINEIRDFKINDLITRGATATTTPEYNCDLRRLLPWPAVTNTKRKMTEFGLIWVTVRKHENVDKHRHDEEECFVVLSGTATLEIEGQSTSLGPGDVAYIPRFWMHQIRNETDTDFQFLDIYWDDKGRSLQTYRALQMEGIMA